MAEPTTNDHDRLLQLVPRVDVLKESIDRIETKLDRCQGQRTQCASAMTEIRVAAARQAGRSGALWGIISALFVVVLAALVRAYVLSGMVGSG